MSKLFLEIFPPSLSRPRVQHCQGVLLPEEKSGRSSLSGNLSWYCVLVYNHFIQLLKDDPSLTLDYGCKVKLCPSHKTEYYFFPSIYLQDGCVYTGQQDPSLMVCFRTGSLPVKCLAGNFKPSSGNINTAIHSP